MIFLKIFRIYDIGVSNDKFHKIFIALNQTFLQSGVWPQIQVFLSVGKLQFSEGGCEGIDSRDLENPLA